MLVFIVIKFIINNDKNLINSSGLLYSKLLDIPKSTLAKLYCCLEISYISASLFEVSEVFEVLLAPHPVRSKTQTPAKTRAATLRTGDLARFPQKVGARFGVQNRY